MDSNLMDLMIICMNPFEDKIVRMRNGSLPINQWDPAFSSSRMVTGVEKNSLFVRKNE